MKNRAAFAARPDHPRLFAGAADCPTRRAIVSRLDCDDVVLLNVARPSITRRRVTGQYERDHVAGVKADDATVVGFGKRNVYQTVAPYDSLKNAPAM